MNVLVSLHRGYGMGDAVQMSAVLRHVRKYRPHWVVDFQAENGRECVGHGIAHNTFVYGQPYPHDDYAAEVQICLYDTWANWHDRPNTRVSSCLHERFGLPWDKSCGRYHINVRKDARCAVQRSLGHFASRAEWNRMVAIHYRGDSSPLKKNLTDREAADVCDEVLKLGFIPLVMDWRNDCYVTTRPGVRTTGGCAFSREWGASAEMNCAVISECAAFVGIDSGPSKCASATDTPALVVWTGHHPAPFHDPAPNTTHLVPKNYHSLEPVCRDPGVIKWFEANHNVKMYGDSGPVGVIKEWLWDKLRRTSQAG